MFTTLAERARSTVGTVAVLGAGQLALHQLIELLNPSHAAHHLAGPGAPSGIGMLATHAVATLLTAAALRFADRAIAAVGAALRRVLPRRPPGAVRRPPAGHPGRRPAPPSRCASRAPWPPPRSGAALRWGADPHPHPSPPTGAPPCPRPPAVARCAPASCPPSPAARCSPAPPRRWPTSPPSPAQAEQGDYAVIALRVPTESDTAGTVKLQVTLPTDTPITSVRTTPRPGWTATMTTVPLNPPVERNGRTLTEAVSTVTWTADPGTRIGPGEFADFPLSLGPLPEVDRLVLPAVQTYDDGEVVAWDQPPAADGAEPERPAPTVTLAPAGRAPGEPAARRLAAAQRPPRRRRPGRSDRPLAGRRRPAARRARPRARGRRPAAAARIGGQVDDRPAAPGRRRHPALRGSRCCSGRRPAFAHTRLQSSDPADGTSLGAGPQRVSLTFNEPMQTGFATAHRDRPGQPALPVRRGHGERRHRLHRGRPARPGRPLRDRLPGGLRGRAPGHRVGRVHPDRSRSGGGHATAARPPPSSALAAPASATPAPTSAAPAPVAASTSDDGGMPVWPWIVGGVVLIGVGAAAALRLGRG